jgi:hypothetical protein
LGSDLHVYDLGSLNTPEEGCEQLKFGWLASKKPRADGFGGFTVEGAATLAAGSRVLA